MKKLIALFCVVCLLFSGCAAQKQPADIVATTLPVYEFTLRLCQGTQLSVARLISQEVSCLHDYALSVSQVQAVEAAELVVLSGGGLEDFMADLLADKHTVNSAEGLELLHCEHEHDHDHHHEADAHIWLSPEYARVMAQNICAGLCWRYPRNAAVFQKNLEKLLSDIEAVEAYGRQQLQALSSRELITFHDGFSYFAHAFDLNVLKAMEEESGAEASAAELIELITLVRQHQVPAVFTERNGSTSAAGVVQAETGVKIFTLDMAMSGDSWFDAMYHNINAVKEALG